MDGLSNPTSCVRHRYGRTCISAPMPTIPSMINTSSPITIQPCNAVMFSSFTNASSCLPECLPGSDYSKDLRLAEWGLTLHFAQQQSVGPNVRFGSITDIPHHLADVRFTPESRHSTIKSNTTSLSYCSISVSQFRD